jgi:hypothetical protein
MDASAVLFIFLGISASIGVIVWGLWLRKIGL